MVHLVLTLCVSQVLSACAKAGQILGMTCQGGSGQGVILSGEMAGFKRYATRQTACVPSVSSGPFCSALMCQCVQCRCPIRWNLHNW